MLTNPFRALRRSSRAADADRLRQAVAAARAKADATAARLAAIKTALAAREGDVRRLQAEVARLREQRRAQRALQERLTARLKETEAQSAHRQTRIDTLQRSILRHTLLRDALPLRAVVAEARARQPEARHREEAFRAVSPAYRAVSDAPPDPALRSTRIQGRPWWYPVVSARQASPEARWDAKQKFPYRAIVQTRELAMGGVMLDIGANTGRMSVSRALLGDVTAAYCAEPDPLNYAALVRNAIDNGLGGIVLPDQVAIGDADGVAHLRRSQFSGGHRLVADGGPDIIEVPVRTLDGWLAALGVDLDLVTFVKVDAQGWERQVLAGAPRVLARRHIAWQMEVAPKVLRAAGTDPRDVLARLAAAFTHFTDLSREATGTRSRPIAELHEAIAHVLDGRVDQTDLLLYSTAPALAAAGA